MPRIAISYRRSDSSAISGRIFDRLVAQYGKPSVFMDIDNIPFGTDFRSHIEDALQKTDVLLAVIGQKWTGRDGDAARILEERDPIRAEIESALARKLPIIPVLVEGARMPDSGELPQSFGNFAFLNAAEVATGRDFHTHMDNLIAAIDRTMTVADASHAGYSPAQTLATALLRWCNDLPRYGVVPLALLLVAHYVIFTEDLDTRILDAAVSLVPLPFGFLLFWKKGRGTGPALALALALGIVGAAGMTVIGNLSVGDPILPQTLFEWRDTSEFAVRIALGFMAGHVAAQVLRGALARRLR